MFYYFENGTAANFAAVFLLAPKMGALQDLYSQKYSYE
jgi:hypothetical protein